MFAMAVLPSILPFLLRASSADYLSGLVQVPTVLYGLAQMEPLYREELPSP